MNTTPKQTRSTSDSGDAKPADNIDIEDGLTVDLDDQKRLIGIEILDVSHRLPPDTLATITVQNLVTANP